MGGAAEPRWEWLFAHQIGSCTDGTLAPAGTKVHAWLALAGLAGLVVLTTLGAYPRSTVGTESSQYERADALHRRARAVARRGRRAGAATASAGSSRSARGPRSSSLTDDGDDLPVAPDGLAIDDPGAVLGVGRPIDSMASWWLQRLRLLAPALVLRFGRVFDRLERPGPAPVA